MVRYQIISTNADKLLAWGTPEEVSLSLVESISASIRLPEYPPVESALGDDSSPD
jgi:hypothetical protein